MERHQVIGCPTCGERQLVVSFSRDEREDWRLDAAACAAGCAVPLAWLPAKPLSF